MTKPTTAFHRLAEGPGPYLLGNVWDAPSARAAAAAGFEALGTSSAATSAILGREDGEDLAFEELLLFVRAIRSATDLPLSVDVEHGYGATDAQAADNVVALARLGVTGVNVEDSVVAGGARGLVRAERFAERLTAITAAFGDEGLPCFVNARCDAFLLGVADAGGEATGRGKVYREAGADGLFLPGLTDVRQLARITQATALPLNYLTLPGGPDWDALAAAGVSRVSTGNFLHDAGVAHLTERMSALRRARRLGDIFAPAA